MVSIPNDGKIAFATKPGVVAVKVASTPAKAAAPTPNIARVKTVRVVAVPGRLVLMPERAFQAITEEPTSVPLNAFYAKALKNGDLDLAEDAASAAPQVAPGFRPVKPKPAAAPAAPSTASAAPAAEPDATAKA